MTTNNITWRTFDGNDSERWNLLATPSFYIIDHHGTIRRKWVGKPGMKSLDSALDMLIQQAEKAAINEKK